MEEPTPNNEDERLRRLEESLLAAEERSRQREERDRLDREERRRAMEALNAHTGGSIPPPPPTPPGPPATPPPPPTPPPPRRPGFFNRKRLRTAALAAGLATIGGGGYEVGKKLKWWGKGGTEVSSSERGERKGGTGRDTARDEALKRRNTTERKSDSPMASRIAERINLGDITLPLADIINGRDTALNDIIDAIIANEGHSPPGVKNNPGNIKFYRLSGQIDSGVRATDGGTFASYATEQDGKNAIAGLITGAAARGYTFEEFINGYTNTGKVRFNRASAPPPKRTETRPLPTLPPMPFETPPPEPEPEKEVPPPPARETVPPVITQTPITAPETTRETRTPRTAQAPAPSVVFVSPFKNKPREETSPAKTEPAPEIPDYKPDANRPILRHTPDRKVETIPGPPPLPPVRNVEEAKKRVYESYDRSGETVTNRGEGGDNVIYNSNPGGVGLGGGRPPLGISPREILILQTHPEFAKNPFHLTPERLIQVYQMHQRNIALIFQHHDDGMNAWMDMKDLKASSVFNAKNPDPKDRLFIYMQKLYRVTGLKPQDKMFGRYETVNEYLARALQKAASLGKLTEMKEE